jgi:hypothetical protein
MAPKRRVTGGSNGFTSWKQDEMSVKLADDVHRGPRRLPRCRLERYLQLVAVLM